MSDLMEMSGKKILRCFDGREIQLSLHDNDLSIRVGCFDYLHLNESQVNELIEHLISFRDMMGRLI